MAGGKCGQRGLNLLKKAIKQACDDDLSERSIGEKRTRFIYSKELDYRIINIGAKNTVDTSPGDRIVIYTPGGGGFGEQNGFHRNGEKGTDKKVIKTEVIVRSSGSLHDYQSMQESI
jgi:5-oxoprolinase (ATP-hydrolysing)